MTNIKKLQVGQIVNVQAYKHNGRMYRQWNGVKVLEVSPYSIVLFMFKSKVIEDNGQRWVVREPTFWWFPIDEYYNTTGLVRPSGTHFYTNLASPPIFEDNTIKFIDYDLDIKAYPLLPIKVVDKNEFKYNAIEYDYPQNIIEMINKTTDYVIKLIKNGEGYFDNEVVDTYIQSLIEQKILSKKWSKWFNDL